MTERLIDRVDRYLPGAFRQMIEHFLVIVPRVSRTPQEAASLRLMASIASCAIGEAERLREDLHLAELRLCPWCDSSDSHSSKTGAVEEPAS